MQISPQGHSKVSLTPVHVGSSIKPIIVMGLLF